MVANISSPPTYTLLEDPNYPLLPLIWGQAGMSISLLLIIIHYLDAKPLHSRTVMDFVNKVFMGHMCLFAMLVAALSTLISLFEDLGSVAATVLGYLSFVQFSNLCLIALVIKGTQLMLVRHPMYLESTAFERNVRGMAAFAVPIYTAILATAMLLTSVKPISYYILRGTTVAKMELTITSVMQPCILFVAFSGYWLTSIWIRKIQPQERSNHILGYKPVGLLCIDGAILYAMSLILNQKYSYQIGSNLAILKFSASIVFFHESVFYHACQLNFLRSFSILSSLRNVRRVEVSTTAHNDSIHGVRVI